MGTRGAIARPGTTHEGSFAGRYHHWDSYPSGLGRTLFELWNGHFGRDTDKMMSTLIDQHPAGWSSINGADFTQPSGFHEDILTPKGNDGPTCYCHGDRSETDQTVTDEDASSAGVEWVYVLDGPVMHILSSRNEDGSKAVGMFGSGNPDATWVGVALVELAGEAPDWGEIEERGAEAA